MQFDRDFLKTRFLLRRVLFFLLAVLLSLQLFALTQHHHDLSTQSDHCSACQLANNFTGDPPVMPAVFLLTTLFLAYFILLHALQIDHPVLHRHLRPLSQAPPYA
ncbi:MAG: hypothetical protein ACYCSS_03780 [Sulfuriferula sp.]